MQEDQFTLRSLFKHAKDYFKALLKKGLLSSGELLNKSVKVAVWIGAILLFFPVFIILLFTSLGFSLAGWLEIGYGLAFLLAALVAIVVCMLVVWGGLVATRAKRSALLASFLEMVEKLEESKEDNRDNTIPPPLDTIEGERNELIR